MTIKSKEEIWKTQNSNDFEQFVSDLQVFAEYYVPEIVQHLCDIAWDIYQDKSIVKMLHNHAERVEKSRKEQKKNMLFKIRHPEMHTSMETFILDDPQPYRDVLADLLVDDWWHEQCDKQRKEKETA